MRKRVRRGYFVTFEGPEGCGKSSQVKKAGAYLKQKGYRVLCLREPGGTGLSEAIRGILLGRKFKGMEPETELLLYLAARSEVVRKKIIPALARGLCVLCDRYEDSTLAYQGYGRCAELRLQEIRAVSSWVRRKVMPCRTFLLDIDPQKGLARGGRRDRMENQSLRFHRRVRRGFLELAKKEPDRFVVIDGEKDIRAVAKLIRERLDRDLG